MRRAEIGCKGEELRVQELERRDWTGEHSNDAPADAERWEAAIEHEYQARLQNYPGQELEWRLLYSPRRVLAGARVAFIGLNPGGRFVDPTHGKFSSEAGSAYRREVEDWGPSSGLQDQVMALFDRLDIVPEDVLAGNLVPFRSPSEDSLLGAAEAISFGRALWADILDKVKPTLVVSMGGTANREIKQLLNVRNLASHPIGWGNYTASRGVFEGGTWIGLPHLSRFAIMKRSKSEAALNVLFKSID
ncbi:uracil-DNA glycosylase family protein [Sulfitobacter mediterraneus]|uniref:uracil-DNA glycosylase family protein n=1 Tax=Sulfitobacter mediterraneus TaxID=83219 RepID=UPI0021A3BC3B|nr:uracil-DNA glycosylase family protein [Sulfitobacter mediterraneus]UWR10903.1 uracil-DNA glycosylase family protein [Sulfitobacter mediterraneus]